MSAMQARINLDIPFLRRQETSNVIPLAMRLIIYAEVDFLNQLQQPLNTYIVDVLKSLNS
jgi:hypothetical protein